MNYKTQKIINKITFGLSEMGAGFTMPDIWYNFKHGIKNLRRFFWVVWKYRGFDFQYNLDLLKRGLEVYLTMPNYEVDETRIPKETDIKRVIEIIENLGKSDYITEIEKEHGEVANVGMDFQELDKEDEVYIHSDGGKLYEWVDNRTEEEKEHSSKVYDLATELEQKEWEELFNKLKSGGQSWWN